MKEICIRFTQSVAQVHNIIRTKRKGLREVIGANAWEASKQGHALEVPTQTYTETQVCEHTQNLTILLWNPAYVWKDQNKDSRFFFFSKY